MALNHNAVALPNLFETNVTLIPTNKLKPVGGSRSCIKTMWFAFIIHLGFSVKMKNM